MTERACTYTTFQCKKLPGIVSNLDDPCMDKDRLLLLTAVGPRAKVLLSCIIETINLPSLHRLGGPRRCG